MLGSDIGLGNVTTLVAMLKWGRLVPFSAIFMLGIGLLLAVYM